MFTTIKKQLMSLITITSMLVMVFGVSAMYANAAAAPNIVSYQGRLLDSNGTPVANASLSMKFFFYDSLAGGTCLWSNSSSDCDGNTPASTVVRAVTLTSGLFSAELGDTAHAIPYTSIPDSVFGDN